MDLGYLTLPPLDKEKCDSIVKQLKTIPFRARNKSGIMIGLHYNAGESNIYEVMNQKIIFEIPEIQELSNDPNLLKIVEEHLGAKPIQTQANCWFSVKYSNKELSDSAQMFHQDHTYRNFVKLFLYLNDVTKENGCHVYVPNSVKKGVEPPKSRASLRVSDDYIKENYPEIKYIEGEKGTMTLVDTRGWHKGNPVKTGHRLLIQLEWTDNITHLATGKQIKYI